jgi:hypothetical protein
MAHETLHIQADEGKVILLKYQFVLENIGPGPVAVLTNGCQPVRLDAGERLDANAAYSVEQRAIEPQAATVDLSPA